MQFLFADAVYIVPINVAIWAICIGVNLGFIVSFFSRNIAGDIVRRLLALPIGEENAKTLGELGYKKVSFLNKVLLKDGSALRRIVFVLGGQIPMSENTEGISVPDFASARFYIPESQRKRAEITYGEKQKWIFLPIFVILSISVSALMAWLMPMLMDAII